MISFVVGLMVLLGVSAALYYGTAASRLRRRRVWELERAEWRRWISRP